jgi:hypothetical protein
MSQFEALFRTTDRPVGDHFPPDRRGELFPGVLAQSQRLHSWVAGQPIRPAGRYLLIGVVTWSGYDMKLLDRIETATDALSTTALRIDVFDADALGSIAAIERLIPGVNVRAQTPFVGYWVDGVLTEVAAGAWGRRLVAKVCGLDPDELDRFVLTRSQPV